MDFLTRSFLLLACLTCLGSVVVGDVGVDFQSWFKNYTKSERPGSGGDAVVVTLTAYILSFPEIDTREQSITLNMYFRQKWKDSRFAKGFSGNLPAEYWDKIWLPDTFIVNELKANKHIITVPNTLVKVKEDGEITLSTRYTVTASCPMDFRYFPFDEQECAVEFESYGFSAQDIVYEWKKDDNALGYVKTSKSEFNVIAARINSTDVTVGVTRYNRAWLNVLVKRDYGRYMKEFYYPCLILVSVSFICASCMGPNMALICSFLTLGFTILFSVESSGALEGPRISYATALDEYMSITQCFVLLSFFISLLQHRLLSKVGSSPELVELSNLGQGRSRVPDSDDVNLCEEGRERPDRRPKLPPSRVDAAFEFIGGILLKLMPIVKPLLIIIFGLVNLIYWTTRPNMGISHDEDQLAAEAWKIN